MAKPKIGWHRGSDTEWAFTYLANEIIKKTPEFQHLFNERADINMILAVVFVKSMKVDKSCIIHMDGNRWYAR